MRVFCILALFLLALAPSGAFAAKKVALIIGNDNYREISTLLKAREDAQGYRAFFKSEGYMVIGDNDGVKVDDLTKAEMRRALRAFYNNIERGTQAIFIYSGHGWSDGVRNYLVPTDAPSVVDEDEVIDASIVLQDGYNGVIDRIKKAGARLTVALIDACRNDPFKHRAGNTRAYGNQRGLAAIPKEAMPFGTYVMYSAGAHQEALDRLSNNDSKRYSVFTRHFLPLLEQRQPLRQAFNTARFQTFEAAKSINHDQLPAQYDEVVQPNICLSDTCKMSTTTAVNTPPPQSEGSQCGKLWDLVMSNSSSCADLRRFSSSFPGTQCSRNAERRLETLACPGYGQKEPEEPTIETYTATDFDNSRAEHLDLRRYNNSSLDACKRACVRDGQCNYFTYNERYRVCFTKKGVSKRVAFNGAISGKVIRPGQNTPSTPQQARPQPQPTPAPQVASTGLQFQTYYDTDFPGGDMTFSNGSIFTKTSEAGCRSICENEQRCKAYTFNQRNNACFIKSRVGPSASFKGAVSGVVRGR